MFVKQTYSGVNAIRWCPLSSKLYTAGRDSIIRKWSIKDTINDKPYFDTMEHHTDWINDIIVCARGEYLISASNDQSLKVWNAKKSSCLSTLRTHKDYVSCLGKFYHDSSHRLPILSVKMYQERNFQPIPLLEINYFPVASIIKFIYGI